MDLLALRGTDHGLMLNGAVRTDDPARIDQVARDLEGVFAKMMISAMREASFGDSLFGESNTHFRDMYDQQIAQRLAEGQGLGLAPMIRRQLGGEATAADVSGVTGNGFPLHHYTRPLMAQPMADGSVPIRPEARPAGHVAPGTDSAGWPLPDRGRTIAPGAAPAGSAPAAGPVAALPTYRSPAADAARARGDGARNPEAFVAEIWPHAQRAAEELGVCAKTIVAQAALETGWGRRPIGGDGDNNANNLFGIKATGRWQGRSVAQSTREVYNGVEAREVARFRAYDSIAESFRDYVGLLKNSPRYADAVGTADGRGFARALQQAGYATDPQYAAKLTAIAEGPTLRRALESLQAGSDPLAVAAAPNA